MSEPLTSGVSSEEPESGMLPSEAATSGLSRAVARYRQFFLEETTVTGVVAFRIFLALWAVFFWAPRLGYVWELYCRPVLRHVHKAVKWLEHPLPEVWLMQAALWSLLVLLVLFAFSRRPRIFHMLLFGPMCLLYACDTLMARAYGALAFVQWCLLFVAPYDQHRGKDGKILLGPTTGRRLLQLEWASVYLFTVPAKLWGGTGWLDGSVLWRTFHGTRYGDWLISHWIDIPMWACAVGCYLAMGAELFIAIGIWFKRTRRASMVCCVALHLGMTTLLRVSPLFPLLMIGHLLLFVSDEEWARLFAWWARLRGRAAPAERAATLGAP